MQTADYIALASLAVSLVALPVALIAIYKSNRNSSVATLVTLNEAFRQGWHRFLTTSNPDMKLYELSELMNLIEIACGILIEKSLSGMSMQIMMDYLNDILKLLVKSEYATGEISKMLDEPGTFANIKQFLNDKKSQSLSVTIPLKWYQQ
jgi:hypothetical protein